MALSPGTTLGPYEILSPIGAGGMGEVYKARDTRLDRTVAIKVLPEHVASDPDLKQRFEREAKTISSLNHPHICTLYDIGEQDGIDFLVMEYLEGETLAQRLQKGALPLDQALQVAIEIADALDKAHRQGITHRDLKPGNIMLTKAGAKLLDFGLAKLKPVEAAGGLTAMPTQSAGLTGEGAILGTLQYMAPEQLEGKEADARTDIFAFGTTVHEMATGKKAFEGTSQASLIGAILKDEARPISALQPLSPPALDRVVKRCMAKDADDRWQTARDLHSELRWVAEGGPQVGAPVSAPTAHPVGWRHVMPMVATGGAAALITGGIGYAHVILGWRYASPVVGAWAAAALMTGGAVWCLMRGWRHAMPYLVGVAVGGLVIGVTVWGVVRPAAPLPAPQTRFAVAPPTGVTPLLPWLSPDGRTIAFTSSDFQVYIRPLNQLEAVPVRGLGSTFATGFSPDGQWLLVSDRQAPGMLKRVPLAGGPATPIAEGGGRAADWGPDDTIVQGSREGLWLVSASGGERTQLTTVTEGEAAHFFPQFLPNGHAVLFEIWTGYRDTSQVALYDFNTGERRTLLPGMSPQFAASGHLVFWRDDSLWAVPFDPDRLDANGTPVPVVEGVSANFDGYAHYGLGADGTLLYVPPEAGIDQRSLVWVDRQGTEESVGAEPRPFSSMQLSPDGRQVVVEVRGSDAPTVLTQTGGNTDIWIYDLGRETTTRFTFHPAEDRWPLWTPDGEQIVFASDRDSGVLNLFSKAADGSGQVERLTTSADQQLPYDFARDGRTLVFGFYSLDLHSLPMDGEYKAEILLQTEFRETQATVSPDGRWLAYVSNESGQNEVWVRPFPNVNDGRWPISNGLGVSPRWGPDSRELFYLTREGPADPVTMMAVANDTEPTFRPGAPVALFEGPYRLGSLDQFHSFDISPDGQRFLMIKRASGGQSDQPPIIVVQHWFDELQRLVPTP